MASKKARPKMLNEVMDAIANLKEPKGSTMKRIVNQLEANFMLSRKSIKMTPIIKALKHGVKMGLIKRHKGKFKLGLDPKDYAVYKTFQKRLKTRETCNRKRCKSKKGKRMSQKKHRRHRLATMDDAGSDTESLPSTADSNMTNPVDRSHRRRKRRSRSKRRSSGRHKKPRRHSLSSDTSDNSSKGGRSSKTSRHSSQSGHSEGEKSSQRKDEVPVETERQYHPNCSNPECLCNVNSEEPINEDI